ncbi:hypothetical protein PT015_10465 [Candidatus Mycobacterium wuenschmannii]|uniref:Uncharacterized protein n=1 Tax=Candidatus Mycobacterium wuenschmannii TaxID=3027808 RepID=A0ABY8W497_9MYCO|nr:hypothetical protein [Candidatus Mycobacterium wuenschmannii]WIM89804.1 hypothetical protein PT015_10465 [Candidatus Mycobacterium wuenschmannii]
MLDDIGGLLVGQLHSNFAASSCPNRVVVERDLFLLPFVKYFESEFFDKFFSIDRIRMGYAENKQVLCASIFRLGHFVAPPRPAFTACTNVRDTSV